MWDNKMIQKGLKQDWEVGKPERTPHILGTVQIYWHLTKGFANSHIAASWVLGALSTLEIQGSVVKTLLHTICILQLSYIMQTNVCACNCHQSQWFHINRLTCLYLFNEDQIIMEKISFDTWLYLVIQMIPGVSSWGLINCCGFPSSAHLSECWNPEMDELESTAFL